MGVNRRKKGTGNTLSALKSIRAGRPDGAPICVILDNLSAHRGADARRRAAKHKVELCLTPTYASWVNLIEAHFGPLRRFTIANSNYPNHTAQTGRCTHTCGGATPTPATATSWPPNARNAPAADARKASAGAVGYSPTAPSMASRRRSAWPTWRAYSSITCSRTNRTSVSPNSRFGTMRARSTVTFANTCRDSSHAFR